MLSSPSSAESGPRSKPENHPSREAFQKFMQGLLEILEKHEPQRWWASVYRYLVRSRRQLDSADPAVKRFLEDHIDAVLEVLREELRSTGAEEQAVAAQKVIHDLAHLLGEPRTEEREKLEVHRVPLEELLVDKDHFALTARTSETGEALSVLKVRATSEDDWSEFVLPPTPTIWHKGGAPRVILKIFAGAPVETIQVELPPNDVDVIALGESAVVQAQAREMGADPDGVEMVESLDIARWMLERDIDLNQCFLGQAGLVYSERALRAAETGNIHLESEDRGLYGTEFFFYDGIRLTKNRGLFRLLKFVAEGKARSFDFLPLNEQVDFGIYWLVLARKLSAKENAGELLNRLFELGRRTGQVHEGEKDIYTVLDRVHAEYPFFRFDERKLDQTGVTRWLAGKLGKLADRRFRREQGIGLTFDLTRHPGDDEPYQVSLDGYTDDRQKDQQTATGWEGFVERCRVRSGSTGS